MDMKKVKKGLECLARKQEPMTNPCSKCDYHDRPNFAFCVVDVATDALKLLKEQEPKMVKIIKNAYNEEFYCCPNCDKQFYGYFKRPLYCDQCGQAVKWNDD